MPPHALRASRLVERAEDWCRPTAGTLIRRRSPSKDGRLSTPYSATFSQGEKGSPVDLVSVAPLLDRCAGRLADPDLNQDGAVGRGAHRRLTGRRDDRAAARLRGVPQLSRRPHEAAIRVRNGAARSRESGD